MDENLVSESKPLSVNDVIQNLQGFGVEDFQEVIPLECAGRRVELRLSNITTEQERLSLLAHEDARGHEWMQGVRLEILSRSISWINGVDIRGLKGRERLVADPVDGIEKDIQIVLREMLRGWGQEIVMVLWRVLMVHSQSIEDRLFATFPEAAKMTDVQRRLEAQAFDEIERQSKQVIAEQVTELFGTEEGAA